MYRYSPSSTLRYRQRLLGGGLLWLLAGSVLVLTGLLPAYTTLLGWSVAFWLVLAPLTMLLALEPSLPRQLLARCVSRRRTCRATAWY